MGIVNITTDSFSDGGRYLDADAAIAHGHALLAAGADILDIGGESTRPGAERVDARVEQARVIPVITALAAAGAVISIDTMNASTATLAVGAGASVINDVSGGLADADMLSAAASTTAAVILGHWRGPSTAMYERATYARIGEEVAGELAERVHAATVAGIPHSRIIVDPGIGFGKQPPDNWALLRELPALIATSGLPVLVGTSRKRLLDTALGADASLRRKDLATAVTSALAARAGAWGVRVHDVASTRDALAVQHAWDGDARTPRKDEHE